MSQDESRLEDKTEFHGIEEKGVNCIYISFVVEPNAKWEGL